MANFHAPHVFGPRADNNEVVVILSKNNFGAIFVTYIYVIYATLWTTKVKKKNEVHKVGSPDRVGLGYCVGLLYVCAFVYWSGGHKNTFLVPLEVFEDHIHHYHPFSKK